MKILSTIAKPFKFVLGLGAKGVGKLLKFGVKAVYSMGETGFKYLDKRIFSAFHSPWKSLPDGARFKAIPKSTTADSTRQLPEATLSIKKKIDPVKQSEPKNISSEAVGLKKQGSPDEQDDSDYQSSLSSYDDLYDQSSDDGYGSFSGQSSADGRGAYSRRSSDDDWSTDYDYSSRSGESSADGRGAFSWQSSDDDWSTDYDYSSRSGASSADGRDDYSRQSSDDDWSSDDDLTVHDRRSAHGGRGSRGWRNVRGGRGARDERSIDDDYSTLDERGTPGRRGILKVRGSSGVDKDNMELFLRALESGDVDEMDRLYKRNLVAPFAVEKGRSLFHLALELENLRSIDWFLKNASTKYLRRVNDEGDSPLHMAVEQGDPRIMRSLLASGKFELNARDKKGYPPLFRCYMKRANAELYRMLCGAGASLVEYAGALRRYSQLDRQNVRESEKNVVDFGSYSYRSKVRDALQDHPDFNELTDLERELSEANLLLQRY